MVMPEDRIQNKIHFNVSFFKDMPDVSRFKSTAYFNRDALKSAMVHR
jgi:hypothetical protein